MRATGLDDRPRSGRRLVFSQGRLASGTKGAPVAKNTISRFDMADVCVKSLLDPRACNVVCTVSESASAAPSPGYEQDISKALEVLEPNRN